MAKKDAASTVAADKSMIIDEEGAAPAISETVAAIPAASPSLPVKGTEPLTVKSTGFFASLVAFARGGIAHTSLTYDIEGQEVNVCADGRRIGKMPLPKKLTTGAKFTDIVQKVRESQEHREIVARFVKVLPENIFNVDVRYAPEGHQLGFHVLLTDGSKYNVSNDGLIE